MKRWELLVSASALSAAAAGLPRGARAATTKVVPLTPPAGGVPVAFLLSNGAQMIDFAGPWEVFQDARLPSRAHPAFTLYTVAESTQPLAVTGGAKVVPEYDFQSAPAPKVVVVPAQDDATPAVKTWLNGVAGHADLIMSVCTGAFVLAEAGLLDGRTVTTHHGAFTTLAMGYPKLTVARGARFVDEGRIATSAGLSAGIDLALHVVARYYGGEVARQTAYFMEYASQGWRDAASNAAYARPPVARAGEALCPVCWMNVDPKNAPTSTYAGMHYYFCTPDHKARFDAAPARFLA